MRRDVEDFCDCLDAAIFNGDAFHNFESLGEMEAYLERWKGELVRTRKMLESPDTDDDWDIEGLRAALKASRECTYPHCSCVGNACAQNFESTFPGITP